MIIFINIKITPLIMAKIIPDVQKKFDGRIPLDYQNTFPYWGFLSREELRENPGKLLILDIDFGRYCSLKCPTCFRGENVVDDTGNKDLSYDELIRIVDEARTLGLKYIKICGSGEPTQAPRFLDFIRDMTERDIGVAIFTNGQVLGSDEHAKRHYSRCGIKTAAEMCDELLGLRTSIMLKFQSFDTEV